MANQLINKVLLNQYRVTEFIAAGGMGAVYKVYDLTKNVYLAMKVLNIDVDDDPSVIKYFKREANAYRNLSHPNIVPFYGMEQTDEMLFMLQKYVDGDSLRAILLRQKGHPLAVKEVLTVMKALCASLGYAHYKGVVHCDVKPGNVLVDQGGNIFLTDFGIARHAESTNTSMAEAGTVAYMAPEQILGESVSAETDIYAMGVMLFELLTGQRPFRGKESDSGQQASTKAQIRASHLHEPAPDPRSIKPEIPEQAARVVLKALEKNPKSRFQSTQDLFGALCAAYETNPEAVSERISPNLVLKGRQAIPGDAQGEGPKPTRDEENAPAPAPSHRVPVWLLMIVGIAILSAFAIPLMLPNGNNGQESVPASAREITTSITGGVESSGAGDGTNPTEPAPVRALPTATVAPSKTPTEEPTRIPQAGDTKSGPNGMQLVYVPPGEFLMGTHPNDPYSGEAKFQDEQPQHTVFVDGFWMFETEVTNGMFEEFVQSTGYRTTAETTGTGFVTLMDREASSEVGGADWRNPYGPGSDIQGMETYPVTQLSWYDAQSYCEWAGGRLPTEAEWEKAARGENGNIYPWGNKEPSGAEANSADAALNSDWWSDRSINDGFRLTAPVKSFPAGKSPYGFYDMAGNVWEWVADWYNPNGYSSAAVTNPIGPSNGTEKVLKGGSFVNGKKNIRSARRGSVEPETSLDVYGFRCVIP